MVNFFCVVDIKCSGDGLDIEEIYEFFVEAFYSVDGMFVVERGLENFDVDKFKLCCFMFDECR